MVLMWFWRLGGQYVEMFDNLENAVAFAATTDIDMEVDSFEVFTSDDDGSRSRIIGRGEAGELVEYYQSQHPSDETSICLPIALRIKHHESSSTPWTTYRTFATFGEAVDFVQKDLPKQLSEKRLKIEPNV